MAGEWHERKLGDVITLKRGYDLASTARRPGSVPIVSSSGVSGYHDTAMASAPGVITGRYGTIGEVFYVSESFWPLNTTLYVSDFKGSNPRFVSYYLKTLNFSAYSGKAAVPGINRNDLHDADVLWPDLNVQIAIAGMLESLDDKIELNRKLAATLEDMARALFKSWFVNFDPVHAKVEGRDTGLPADIAALFPDSLGDDGLPSGWAEDTVGQLFTIVAGNTPSTKEPTYWGGVHAWATPRDMSGLHGPLLTGTERSLSDQGLAVCSSGAIPEMSLLMSSRAPVGYLAFNALPVSINQGIAAFVGSKLSPLYAWAWCHENMNVIKSNANGSTFQEISKGILRTIPMIAPSKEVHDKFVEMATAIFLRISEIAAETASVTTLRDYLLPKLLSGELQVESTENAIAAA